MMSRFADIAAAVADIYRWIDLQAASWNASCRACGQCCDFDRYDHRLFVTSVELVYFCHTVRENRRKPMTGGVCPHRVNATCSVYEARFAGCRIFSCSVPAEAQSHLSEEAIAGFKQICGRFNVPYAYMDLKAALNDGQTDPLEG